MYAESLLNVALHLLQTTGMPDLSLSFGMLPL
jgi:hypothetical protein